MTKGLWLRQVKHNRTIRDTVEPCEREDWLTALNEGCHAMDLGRPIVIEKHMRDFTSFGQTRFLPEHFLESVPFDRLEAEYIDGTVKKSKDPRNA